MMHSLQRWAVLVALFAVLMIPAGTARAIYIEADLPISLNFTDKNTDSPDSVSGFLVTVGGLFLGLGVGGETYTATWKASGGGSSAEIAFSFIDIVWSPPLPVVNLTLGAGFGNPVAQGSLSKVYDEGSMTQFLVRLGLPIATLFDVHVGYHMLTGKLPGHPTYVAGVNVTPDDVTLDGSLTTIGVRVGF